MEQGQTRITKTYFVVKAQIRLGISAMMTYGVLKTRIDRFDKTFQKVIKT